MARLQSGAVQFTWQLESAPDEAASATAQQMIITDQKQSRTDAIGQGRTPVLVDMNADCRSIIVNAPVAEVYRRCLEFEKLPEFIPSIRKIEKTSPTSFSCLWATKDAELTTNVKIIMRVRERRMGTAIASPGAAGLRRLSRRRGVSRFARWRNHQGDNKGPLHRRTGNADSAGSPSSQLQTIHRTRHEMNMLAARVTSFAGLL